MNLRNLPKVAKLLNSRTSIKIQNCFALKTSRFSHHTPHGPGLLVPLIFTNRTTSQNLRPHIISYKQNTLRWFPRNIIALYSVTIYNPENVLQPLLLIRKKKKWRYRFPDSQITFNCPGHSQSAAKSPPPPPNSPPTPRAFWKGGNYQGQVTLLKLFFL